MKLSSVVATTLAAASSALAAKTTVTATLGDHVYTKTIDIPDADETAPSGYYLSTIIVTRGDTVYTKVVTEQSAVATSKTTSSEETASVIVTATDEEITSAGTTSAEETSATEEASTTEYETKTLTLYKNDHWFTKTVTQPVGFVWTGEPTTYTGVPPWASSSADEASTTPAEEASTTEYETKTLTLYKNDHWFTKTVTQPVGFVWTGEPTTYTGVPPWASSSADEASTNPAADELETKTLTLTKNGHVFTKTVTQTKGFVWTGEPSRSATASSGDSNDDITSYSNSTSSATDSIGGQSSVSIETQTVTDKSSTTATITSCSEGVCHTTTLEPSTSTVVTTVVDGVTIVTTVPCTATSTVECTEEQCQKTKEPESTVFSTVVEGVTVTSTIPCSQGLCQKTISEQPAVKTTTNGNDQQSAVKTITPGDNVQPTTTATRIDTVKTTIVKSTSATQSSPAQTVSTYTGGADMASVGTGIFAAAIGVMLL